MNDIIISKNLDFLFLTETWLTEGSCATVLNETAPVKFSFMNMCKTGKKGGRVAAPVEVERTESTMEKPSDG